MRRGGGWLWGLDGGCEGQWVGWEGSRPGLRVDLRLFYPQFSTDSYLLGENKVNRNPHNISLYTESIYQLIDI